MIGRWSIDGPGRILPPPPTHLPQVDRTLVYYDGPQWLIVSEERKQYAAYAADETDDGDLVRWIEAPVSGVEIRALLAGKMPMRDVLLKPHCRVIDYRGGRDKALHSWTIPGNDIPAECLPDEDALLPTKARESTTLPETTAIAFECDGPAISDSSISFSALGDLVSCLQRIWTAIAETMTLGMSAPEVPTLAFAGSRRGSFAIDAASADQAAAVAIANKYRDIVRASYTSSDRLDAALGAMGPKLYSAFIEYIGVLVAHKMDVFADWRNDGAFVGYGGAERAQEAALSTRKRTDSKLGDATVRGYLTGWMTDRKRFELRDMKSNAIYIGNVSKEAARYWSVRPPVLGKADVIYEGVVRTAVSAEGKTSFRLVRLAAVSDSFSSSKKS